MTDEEIMAVVKALVPEVRVFETDGSGDSPTEMERYPSFAWPHVGEIVYSCGASYEVWRVEHFIIEHKPHIDCYATIVSEDDEE